MAPVNGNIGAGAKPWLTIWNFLLPCRRGVMSGAGGMFSGGDPPPPMGILGDKTENVSGGESIEAVDEVTKAWSKAPSVGVRQILSGRLSSDVDTSAEKSRLPLDSPMPRP